MVYFLLGFRATRAMSLSSFVHSLLDKDYNSKLGAPHKPWPATPSQVRPFPLPSPLPFRQHDPASHFTGEEEHQEGTSWPPTRHRRSSICASSAMAEMTAPPHLYFPRLLLSIHEPALFIDPVLREKARPQLQPFSKFYFDSS